MIDLFFFISYTTMTDDLMNKKFTFMDDNKIKTKPLFFEGLPTDITFWSLGAMFSYWVSHKIDNWSFINQSFLFKWFYDLDNKYDNKIIAVRDILSASFTFYSNVLKQRLPERD